MPTDAAPTANHTAAATTHVRGRARRSVGNSRSSPANRAYQPATHHVGGPATQTKPPGIAAKPATRWPMTASVASQARPQIPASEVDTADTVRQRNPQAIATATNGATSGLSRSPTGLTR